MAFMGPVRTVGTRKESAISFHASSQALERGLRFVDSWAASGQVVGRKGVRHFKTHQEANEDWLNTLACGMAQKHLEKSHAR